MLRIALRLFSLAGLGSSALGTWTLIHSQAGAAPVTPPAAIASTPASTPTPAVSTSSPSPIAAPTGPTGAPLASWTVCENDVLSYRVSYPPDWFTADPDAELNCRFFDPEPFAVTTDSPLPNTAVRIYVSQHTYAELLDTYDPSANPEVFRNQSVTIGGHPGIAIEVREPDGSSAYAYVVDIGEQALVIDTFEGNSPDYSSAKSTTDLIASSLEFLSGDAG